MEKPYSPSCERNQQVILDRLKTVIQSKDKKLLEIGSGTGQHAVFMAAQMPQITWYTSDLLVNHPGIKLWLKDAATENIIYPIEYQAGKTQLPQVNADIVYTANTLHIMSWDNALSLIKQLGESLIVGTKIVIYGPFNYKGQFTSDSNANFDLELKKQNPQSGIRDFELVVENMLNENITLLEDIEMPANNRLLYFIKNEG